MRLRLENCTSVTIGSRPRQHRTMLGDVNVNRCVFVARGRIYHEGQLSMGFVLCKRVSLPQGGSQAWNLIELDPVDLVIEHCIDTPSDSLVFVLEIGPHLPFIRQWL